MQADQKLWDQVFQKEGQRDPTRTREEILQLFDNHLKVVFRSLLSNLTKE